jgi:hypothetical protein
MLEAGMDQEISVKISGELEALAGLIGEINKQYNLDYQVALLPPGDG